MDDGDFSQFLIALHSGERVLVQGMDEIRSGELAVAAQWLTEFERRFRTSLPGTAPLLAPDVALWAATRFYRACQCLAFRDVSPETIEAELDPNCPVQADPAGLAYSVDLTWRFLPDLLKLSAGISADDPLVGRLHCWAVAWPLSSVGVADISDVDISGIMDDPCLQTVYIDRIICRRDMCRLSEPRVRDAVRAAIGAFPGLAPEIVEGSTA